MKEKISKYRIEKTLLNNEWDKRLLKTEQNNIYCHSQYILSLNIKHQAFYCFKSNELMALVLVLLSDDGLDIIHHGLVVHDGIMYRDLSYLNNAQKHSEQFAIQTYIAETLADSYRNITLTLHPSITDVRPLLWTNYHNNDASFIPDIRYTTIINIEDFAYDKALDSIALYKQASVARRQEIRYGRKNNVVVQDSTDSRKLVELYKKTMNRQNISFLQADAEFLESFIDQLLDKKMAVLKEARTNQDEIGSMALFLIENDTAHFLYGANDPELRNQHTGTSVLWESFFQLANLGIKQVNLEGVNSPQRGWFKISFGGDIIPYYQLNLLRDK